MLLHLARDLVLCTEVVDNLPDLGELLAPLLARIERQQQPLLIAIAERMAAARYRQWASRAADQSTRSRLLACADREEDIARRIEELYPEAEKIQKELKATNPGLDTINRELFASRPLAEQYAIQSRGERLGAATWRGFAREAADQQTRQVFLACADLEEKSATVLEDLLGSDD